MPPKKTIEEMYQKMTPREHVLNRSGMYIGDTKSHQEEMWIMGDEGKMEFKPIQYTPGFLKIFDEVLTNAMDHSARDSTVTKIKVNFDKASGKISVFNNGKGIPIVIHKEHDVYVPELIFGHMLSSSNYDDNDKRRGAGTNGLGIKVCSIMSKELCVETVDSDSKQKYIQVFSENMSQKSKPKITKCSGTSYTRITFLPDYPRFEMKKGLTRDTLALLYKRVYDCIACTDKRVTVTLDEVVVKGKGLVDYTRYFFDDGKAFFEQYESNGLLWEYAVVPSESFQCISFVNGNCTYQGGKHVDYIMYQITNKLKTLVETKKKIKDIRVQNIKDRIFLFLRATVINPQFSSQSKELLTTQSKDFGCKIEVPDTFIAKLYKTSIVQDILLLHDLKVQSELKKKTDGTKKNRVFIPNLEDATFAGTNKSDQCTLILTEGLSAKTFAMWGRKNPDLMGIMAMKGKGLNIRDASVKQLLENEEINNLKQIIGLKQGVKYKDTKDLRYGKVLLLVDADLDGSHIKSLIANLFHFWWPELLTLGFLQTLRTPIVKTVKNRKTIEFFTQQDYHAWKERNPTGASNTKYFKGLGTSEKNDAKDIFERFDKLKVDYIWKDKKCDESILLAFDKDKGKVMTDKRKEWLSQYDKNAYIKSTQSEVSFSELIHKELVHFSISDNKRSIPSICDGLKPSQRKILFYMLKNNIISDSKVAQLSGYISAETSYHHGEVSLQQAIITMAQDFIGKNNLNLLLPKGNFGSRYLGGKDAASPRYIFTSLNPLAKTLFNKEDSEILDYIIDEDQSVEPEWYLPIIPMVLVNGCEGIGTGYSTSVPSHNPKDIIEHILAKLEGGNPKTLVPYFKGFKGKVKCLDGGNYSTHGIWKRVGNTSIEITEIPVNTWVSGYKDFLESLVESKTSTLLIKDVVNNTSDENTGVKFLVEFKTKNALDSLLESNDIEKELKLSKPFNTNNMHLFTINDTPKKYNTTTEIIDEYFRLRLDFYEKRRLYQISILEKEMPILYAKIRFIEEYINGKLRINRESRDSIQEQLVDGEYPRVDGSFGYLINLPIISMTLEKIQALQDIIDNKLTLLNNFKETTASIIWKNELKNLQK